MIVSGGAVATGSLEDGVAIGTQAPGDRNGGADNLAWRAAPLLRAGEQWDVPRVGVRPLQVAASSLPRMSAFDPLQTFGASLSAIRQRVRALLTQRVG